MRMSSRDFSQYYSGTYVRRREDGRVFYVDGVRDNTAVLRGIDQNAEVNYQHVLRDYDTFRFDLGWVWLESRSLPVFMMSPAGRSYKKGHVAEEIMWRTVSGGGTGSAQDKIILYSLLLRARLDRRLPAHLSAVDESVRVTDRESAFRWYERFDRRLEQLKEQRSRADTGVAIEIGLLNDDDVTVWSINSVSRKLREAANRVIMEGAIVEGGRATVATRLADCREKLSRADKIQCLEATGEVFSLSDAIERASDHSTVDRLCWRVTPVLALVITATSPENGACIYAGPTCIGEVRKGEIILNEEHRPLFQPFIERQLKE